MNKYLEYKGYHGSQAVSIEDNILYGKVKFINDLISYEAKTPSELKGAFQEAVDDYLDTCSMQGKTPDRPFKGSLNIRIGEDLHKKVALSLKDGESINSFIKNVISEKVS